MKIGWKFFLTLFLGLGCVVNAVRNRGINAENFSNYDEIQNIFHAITLIVISLLFLLKKNLHTYQLSVFSLPVPHLLNNGGIVPESLLVTMDVLFIVLFMATVVSVIKAVIRLFKKSKNKQPESQV